MPTRRPARRNDALAEDGLDVGEAIDDPIAVHAVLIRGNSTEPTLGLELTAARTGNAESGEMLDK